jgi:NAD(P)-dependent dehydrogenase (short-subunit alcohol dehydrogenase family)
MEKATIVLVGGNSGIGAALRVLLEPDHEVVSMSRSQERSVDVTDENPAFPALGGPLQGLVYCPGSITLKPLRTLGAADLRADWEINVLGAFRTVKHYLPNLQAAPHASIVLFSTVAVQTGLPFHASIAAAKGGVEGLTRSLAAELAPTIRVNAIAPSLTETPLAAGLLRTDRQREANVARHPLKRLGRPEDAAALVRFLLTDAGSWITGQILPVDGGMSSTRAL